METIKKYWLPFMIASLMVIIVFPLVVSSIITAGGWLSWFSGTSSVWIGFWGSYLGGIIGTLGVIYVAKLQSDQQRDLNEKAMAEQRSMNNDQISTQIASLKKVEKYNRERLRIETQIKMMETYSKEVKSIYEEVRHIKIQIVKLVGTKKIKDAYSGSPITHENIEKEYRNLKISFEKYYTGYMKDVFQSILYTNSVLYHEDLELEFPEYDAPAKVDELLDYINSPLKTFDVEVFQSYYGELQQGENKKIAYPDVDKCIKWLSNELANTHKNLSELIKILDSDITER